MFGISEIATIPLRKEPTEKSEMLSQLLFGDRFTILEQNSEWSFIKLLSDNYEGWINSKSITYIDKYYFENINDSKIIITNRLFTKVKSKHNQESILLPFGSSLPNFNDTENSFKILNNTYSLEDKYILSDNITELCKQFINAPYLWGGKNPFGIDCSGFTQIIYKSIGIDIPRDSNEQVNLGQNINFISDTRTGDLAFFDNEEGLITHVGIILTKNEIMHASVKVRIDKLDQQGIYNSELKKYTHKLRVIKRLI